MSTEIRIPPTSRSHTSEASVSISGSSLLLGFFAVACVTSVAVAFYAMAKAESALSQAEGARRESRIMSYDVTYMRASLLSRGINIPASHEEAEYGAHSNPEHPVGTITVASGPGARGGDADGVLLRSEPRR